jgi:hypothetical protein
LTFLIREGYNTNPSEDEEVSEFATQFAKNNFCEEQSMLCDICKDIPIRWLSQDLCNSYLLFESLRQLKIYPEECGLCYLIRQSLGVNHQEDSFVELSISRRALIIECWHFFTKRDRFFLSLFACAGNFQNSLLDFLKLIEPRLRS